MKTVGIILTYNNADTIGPCLGSLLDQLEHIIVVDNASSDETIRLASAFPKLTIIRRNKNHGTGSRNIAINLAIQTFEPDYLMMADPDGVFPPSLVSSMLDLLTSKIGIVCVRMLPNGMAYTPTLFDKRVFGATGLYEEAFFAYYEDTYMIDKVREAGFAVINEPYLGWFHGEGQHSMSQISGLRSYMRMRNWFLYNRLTTNRMSTLAHSPVRVLRNILAAFQLDGLSGIRISVLGLLSGILFLAGRQKNDRLKRFAEPLMGYKATLQ